jgi:hypothetical protein
MSAVVTFIGASISALGSMSGLPVGVVVFGALVAAGGALWSSTERTRFERESKEKSEEIADLNRQIAASVTGGDSFCYLQLSSLGVDSANTAILTLVHGGAYPLYEVGFYMADLQRFRQSSDQEATMRQSLSESVQVGNLPPNSVRPLMDWRLPDTDEQDYNIFLNARNGFFTQLLRCKRVNGNWKVATQVRKEREDGGFSVLYEQIDDNFPLNEQGEVAWD